MSTIKSSSGYINNFIGTFHNKNHFRLWIAVFLIFGTFFLINGGRYYYYSNMDTPTASESEKILILSNQNAPNGYNYNLFPFGRVELFFITSPDRKDGEYMTRRSSTGDLAVIYFATWLVALLMIRLFSSSTKLISDRHNSEFIALATNVNNKPVGSLASLESEIISSKKNAQEINLKSNILLGGGIILAFLGIGVFFYAPLVLPEPNKEPRYGLIFIQMVRPTGMLIFVEALAWFLLKQYRALADDYKLQLAEISRKSNALVALHEVEKKGMDNERLLLLASLLQHSPNTIVLKQGETTEAIESQKSSNTNPIFDLVSKIVDKVNISQQGTATNQKTP